MNFDQDDFEMDDRHFHREDDEGEEWKVKPLNDAAKPLLALACQILKTVTAIIETIPEVTEDGLLDDYPAWMLENARKLRIKISSAMATRDYILMSENAVIIKLAARELMTQTSGLEMFGYENQDYLDALRDEIEEFRKLFVIWVRAFVREEPLWPDGWGLFYSSEDVDKWNSINPDERVEE